MEEPPLREAGVGLPPITAPLALLTIAGRHRFVLSNLVRREVRGRYRNAALGYGWTVLEPALLAVVYWFLFTMISGNTDPLYAVWVLIGVIVWSCFGKTLQATVTSLTRNRALIHLIDLPRPIHPVSSMLSNIVLSLMASLVVFPLLLVFGVQLNWTIVLIPVAIILAAFQALGLGLMLAPFNCVQQDVDHLVRFIVRAGFFVSPVMWTWEMAVERGGAYIDLIMLNPMVFPITLARRGFEGAALDMPSQAIVFSIAWGVVTYVVGSMVFCAKERKVVKHL